MALLLEPSALLLPANLTLQTRHRAAREEVALKVPTSTTFLSPKKCAA